MTLRLRKFSHNFLFRHHCSTLNQRILAWGSSELVLNTISSIRIKQAIRKKGEEGEVPYLKWITLSLLKDLITGSKKYFWK